MLLTHAVCDGLFSTVHTNTICMRFRLKPLSRAFSNRCAFAENAQRTILNGTPKRIERYTFSYENALVLTKPYLFVSCDCHLQVLISSLMSSSTERKAAYLEKLHIWTGLFAHSLFNLYSIVILLFLIVIIADHLNLKYGC